MTFRVTSHYADGVTYASREYEGLSPELVVYYVLPSDEEEEEVAEQEIAEMEAPLLEEEGAMPAPAGTPTGAPSLTVPSASPVGGPSGNPTRSPSYNPTVSFARIERGGTCTIVGLCCDPGE